jgi:hypothetical protein
MTGLPRRASLPFPPLRPRKAEAARKCAENIGSARNGMKNVRKPRNGAKNVGKPRKMSENRSKKW